MSRIDPGGPIVLGLAAAIGLGYWLWPAAKAPAPVAAVNLPVATYDAGGVVEEPILRRDTLCPTPAQKEAALPEPIRLRHPEAHPELDADPGPPAADAAMSPREAQALLRRARMRAMGAVEDLDRLSAAVEAMTGEGVKP